MAHSGELLPILKELQRNSKLQQQQIDLLIAAFESKTAPSFNNCAPAFPNPQVQSKYDIAAGITGIKRPLSEVLDRSLEGGAPPPVIAPPPVERKEHLDKILEKPSLRQIWDLISVKLDIDGSIDSLKEKDKILEILKRASEKAKLVCAMTYDTLLTGNLTKIIKEGKPSLDSVCYTVSNKVENDGLTPTVCYAHNPEMFALTVNEFESALADPYTHYLKSPRKALLSEACFSDIAVKEFRSRRQRLPFAICCIRKPGLLTFFVGAWAHEDKSLPNSSNLNHYTTLDMAKFVSLECTKTEAWQRMEKLLESAASPTDKGIGSVSLFMHEHRGNIVCAKVCPNRDTAKTSLQLKIYAHSSCQVSHMPVYLEFNDNGDEYAASLNQSENVVAKED